MTEIAQLALAVQLPDDETFSSFLVESNQQVVAQLKQFITEPSQTLSLYLSGAKGTGKSHLLHACCALAAEQQQSSLCLSFSEIKQLSVAVLDGLEQIDLVCLDDLSVIAGDEKWQRAVFDLFNRMTEQGKRLIISGDNNAAQLSITLPDLMSRLRWGESARLNVLTDDDKQAVLQFRASLRGLILADDVAKFLLNRFTRDLNSLIETLDVLDKASIREQRKITIPFIKAVL